MLLALLQNLLSELRLRSFESPSLLLLFLAAIAEPPHSPQRRGTLRCRTQHTAYVQVSPATAERSGDVAVSALHNEAMKADSDGALHRLNVSSSPIRLWDPGVIAPANWSTLAGLDKPMWAVGERLPPSRTLQPPLDYQPRDARGAN